MSPQATCASVPASPDQTLLQGSVPPYLQHPNLGEGALGLLAPQSPAPSGSPTTDKQGRLSRLCAPSGHPAWLPLRGAEPAGVCLQDRSPPVPPWGGHGASPAVPGG